jgi:hypothetical protein
MFVTAQLALKMGTEMVAERRWKMTQLIAGEGY